MTSAAQVRERYDRAQNHHGEVCSSAPDQWSRPDTAEFTELKRLLYPHAKNGNSYCQYALATIYWLGLCCETQEQYLADRTILIEEATRWWIAAASQGLWRAVDNLITSGLGSEAERVKTIADRIEQECPGLIDRTEDMPIYGAEFMQEVCRQAYGQLITDFD
jgi:hypothetical protein